ncbi:Putrescine transport system permease protein PotH [compost metagenome]
MPGIVGGTLLVFIPASGDYVNSSLLGNNTNTAMIGQVIDARFFKVLDYPTAAALSVVLMAAILLLVGLYVRRAGTDDLL